MRGGLTRGSSRAALITRAAAQWFAQSIYGSKMQITNDMNHLHFNQLTSGLAPLPSRPSGSVALFAL